MISKKLNSKENNYVRIKSFFGTENKDPIEWFDDSEHAVKTNNWNGNCRLQIDLGYLKEVAADWYRKGMNAALVTVAALKSLSKAITAARRVEVGNYYGQHNSKMAKQLKMKNELRRWPRLIHNRANSTIFKSEKEFGQNTKKTFAPMRNKFHEFQRDTTTSLKIDEELVMVVIIEMDAKAKTLGKVKNIKIIVQNIAIPISLQVLESLDNTLLLGTDWFQKPMHTEANAHIYFDKQKLCLHYLDQSVEIPISK
ncbi:hypothetical protein C2G38_2160736 [Gigaspora rosea]|uniref:Uncharacterized protein n=1 Tax=Gigaspora rosea TaxID=44941 RepID=A0A397W4Z4_9GLOM|nr:hypothetical protein C2G38_2160736 [Gigaspora rosea]